MLRLAQSRSDPSREMSREMSPCAAVRKQARVDPRQEFAASFPHQFGDIPTHSGHSGPVLQRKCACQDGGGPCETCNKKQQSDKAALAVAPPIVNSVLARGGEPLPAATRKEMEARFGRGFAGVRVHSDHLAAESARAVNALAYTVGTDIVFGQGRRASARLLAHELAHVVQQGQVNAAGSPLPMMDDAAHEGEADRAASAVVAGHSVLVPSRGARPALARFSDTGHHVIEEAALQETGFSDRISAIEKGNVHRDYSQVGTVGNLALLCQPKAFGGYEPAEHFDNFAYDAILHRWRTRGVGQDYLHDDPNTPDRSPVDYIEGELLTLATMDGDGKPISDASLEHLGNALHTIEDFFAHSNFVELINNDPRFGTKLLTGSYEGEAANATASQSHIFGAIGDPTMKNYYEQTADAATAKTEPQSHSHIAHDMPEAHNYTQARRLAALVVNKLASDVYAVMQAPTANARASLMRQSVLKTIHEYLQPPEPSNPWWAELTDEVVRTGPRTATTKGAIMDRRLAEADERTPVTVNQCVFSPLRNIEASSTSPFKIPIGVALPVQIGSNRVWLQAGVGVTKELPFDRDENAAGRGIPLVGGQLGGHF
jgi:hypothetical protein